MQVNDIRAEGVDGLGDGITELIETPVPGFGLPRIRPQAPVMPSLRQFAPGALPARQAGRQADAQRDRM